MKGDIKGFYQYISSKRKPRKNTDLLLNGAQALVAKDTEKAEGTRYLLQAGL